MIFPDIACPAEILDISVKRGYINKIMKFLTKRMEFW